MEHAPGVNEQGRLARCARRLYNGESASSVERIAPVHLCGVRADPRALPVASRLGALRPAPTQATAQPLATAQGRAIAQGRAPKGRVRGKAQHGSPEPPLSEDHRGVEVEAVVCHVAVLRVSRRVGVELFRSVRWFG